MLIYEILRMKEEVVMKFIFTVLFLCLVTAIPPINLIYMWLGYKIITTFKHSEVTRMLCSGLFGIFLMVALSHLSLIWS